MDSKPDWGTKLSYVLMVIFVGGPWALGVYTIVTNAVKGAGQ